MKLLEFSTLSTVVKQERLKRNLTMKEAAKQSGVSQSSIHRIEARKGRPEFRVLVSVTKWVYNSEVIPKDNEIVVTPGSHLETIKGFIEKDINLDIESKNKLSKLMECMYNTLKDNG